MEGIIADASNAVLDGDARESGTSIKCVIPQVGNVTRDHHAGQVRAIIEGVADTRPKLAHTLAYPYIEQATTIRERKTADGRDAVGYANSSQAGAVPEGSISDISKSGSDNDIR